VKDRAALYLIKDALASGNVRPGDVPIVEGTAGNTGIGLAHLCNAMGLKLVIYMPDTQSREKIDLLRLLGADVRPVPAVPLADPRHYTAQARDFAASLPPGTAYYTNQFDNRANRQAHYETTGPEIWAQTGGVVDAFVCATGTGGTLSGVGASLKERSGGATRVLLADPPGSVLYSFVKTGALERSGGSITEGIGQGRVTENLRGTAIDDAVRVQDADTVAMLFRLLKDEGIFVGASGPSTQLQPGKWPALCPAGRRWSPSSVTARGATSRASLARAGWKLRVSTMLFRRTVNTSFPSIRSSSLLILKSDLF
jgi:cysteine synthase A